MTNEPAHFDQLETRDPEQRERALFNMLPGFLARTMEQAPGWASHLAGVDPHSITSREALSKLPLMRKSSGSAWHEVPEAGTLLGIRFFILWLRVWGFCDIGSTSARSRVHVAGTDIRARGAR